MRERGQVGRERPRSGESAATRERERRPVGRECRNSGENAARSGESAASPAMLLGIGGFSTYIGDYRIISAVIAYLPAIFPFHRRKSQFYRRKRNNAHRRLAGRHAAIYHRPGRRERPTQPGRTPNKESAWHINLPGAFFHTPSTPQSFYRQIH